MALPEILHNVLSFLDGPSLTACLQVSRLWYTHGRTLAWRTLSFDSLLFLRLACDNNAIVDTEKDSLFSLRLACNINTIVKDSLLFVRLACDNNAIVDTEKDKRDKHDNENDKDKIHEFSKNCHHIRSLTLTGFKSWNNLKPPGTLGPRAAGLKNLSHFAVKLEQCSWDSSETYRLAGAILSQNTGIHEITWHGGDRFNDMDLMNLVLKRVAGGKLKKLTISACFRHTKMRFLEYLIDTNKERKEQRRQQEQKQQKGRTLIAQDPLMDDQVEDEMENTNRGNNSGGDRGFELEELVLRDKVGHSIYDESWLDMMWLYDYSGDLPIRAFSFVNIETTPRHPLVPRRKFEEPEENDPGHSILPILSKCPHLESLCVSFDLHPVLPDNSWCRFLRNLEKDPHYHGGSSDYKVAEEYSDFVERMYEYCPRLREIEFGMCYQLTSDHWIEMMRKYGPQLESLSIWGNIPAFNSKAFTTLIGRPVSGSSDDVFHPLTRLNINGMEHLHDCAWMALYLLPHLKEFRARDVPLDAKSLIEEEWVCQGLEVLEIFVAIRKRRQWQWNDVHGWEKGSKWHRGDVEAEWEGESKVDDTDEHQDNQDGMVKTLKRRLKYLGTERPQKMAREDMMKWNGTQMKVCKTLGRLTHLRELRIEGQRHFEFSKCDWGCLELTLETGLEHLAPLQQSLEKLIVSGLDDGLNGRKEVEWIARNWVHNNNSRWLEQHDALSQSVEGPEKCKGVGVRSDDGDVSFDPRSKFKELTGISGNTEYAVSNIKWLREQCPTLSVIEVENSHPSLPRTHILY